MRLRARVRVHIRACVFIYCREKISGSEKSSKKVLQKRNAPCYDVIKPNDGEKGGETVSDLKHIERDIKALLDSDISTNALSRKSDMALSAISRLRSGKIDLQNVRWHNIQKLHRAAVERKDGE